MLVFTQFQNRSNKSIMTIGLISDTHGYLDPRIRDYFANCDEIWHAGDIGPLSTIKSLEEFKPIKAVFGNIDGQEIRIKYPQDLHWEQEGLRIFMTHIAGKPGKYHRRIKDIIKKTPVDLLICGHSHILRVERDPSYNHMLYLNPGAAGKHGFHHKKTMLRFVIKEAKIANLEVIDLGKRGSI